MPSIRPKGRAWEHPAPKSELSSDPQDGDVDLLAAMGTCCSEQQIVEDFFFCPRVASDGPKHTWVWGSFLQTAEPPLKGNHKEVVDTLGA